MKLLVILFSLVFCVENYNPQSTSIKTYETHYYDGTSYVEEYWPIGQLKSKGKYDIDNNKTGRWYYQNELSDTITYKVYSSGFIIKAGIYEK